MKLKFFYVAAIAFLLTSCITDSKSTVEMLELNPSIVTGNLENGVTYFIQENKKPENRIELKLIVNTGSIQEDDDQKGLAHFVEHMAFNGTENFPKDKLVKYLESIGMGFGPEINAYTSFDETVYKLSIPADDPEIIENAFFILEEWAHRVSFEDEEIEKERGVIVEEWRGGRGVQGRFMDRLIPTLLKGSRYAERLTIGDMDVVKNSDPQRLRDYYNEWYRPELMAVAVVGDIDSDLAKSLIEKHFNFTNDYEGRERQHYDTPILDRVDVEIITDPEMTYSEIMYLIKRENLTLDSVENYKEYITELLSIFMFNARMEEIYTKADSPFLNAGAGFAGFVRDLSLVIVSTQVEDDAVAQGFEATLSEIEKVKLYGFNPDEVDRAKARVNMMIQNMYNERDNRESTSIINEIVTYYLEGNLVMDTAYESDILNKILEDISYEELNEKSIELFSGRDRTITIQVPENGDVTLPTETEIKDLFDTVAGKTYNKRAIDIDDRELFNYELTPGSTVSKENIDGITEIVLSNGAKIVVKPTDFKSDEIQFYAASYGGTSYLEDDEFYSGSFATNVAESSGLNGFDNIELDRVLTGKDVSVSPWIREYTEGFSGGSNKENTELMFQLINLYFTHPEFSEESYNVLMANVVNYISNRGNSPQTIFRDRVTELKGSGHFRKKAINIDALEDVNFAEVKEIYLERFKDPGDFTFVFVGNIDVDEFVTLAENYIGSIPTENLNETSKDIGIRFPEGVYSETIEKGIEEKSVVNITFSGDFNSDDDEDRLLSLLTNYLEEQLRVAVREELSGTYGISVTPNIMLYPYEQYSISIAFGCEPGREEELSAAVFKELNKAKDGFIDEDGLEAVRKNFTRSLELDLKENSYWIYNILVANLLDEDYESITDDDISGVTAEKFVELTKKYFNEERFIKVILKPE